MKVVKHLKPGTVHMGRMDYGRDIIETLENYCAEHEIRMAWVQLIGALKKAGLSYYDQEKREYCSRTLSGELEIVSCSGNISIRDNAPMAHLHIILSDPEYGCLGGHLLPGSTEIFACEFALFELQGKDALVRGFDETTGLHLWLY